MTLTGIVLENNLSGANQDFKKYRQAGFQLTVECVAADHKSPRPNSGGKTAPFALVEKFLL